MNTTTSASSSVQPRYVSSGAWTHIFSEADLGEVERTTRWTYDRQEDRLLFVDIRREQKWRSATLDEIEDVSDSLNNGNAGCIDNPQEWDFEESHSLPKWD
jgi:hypothetical protein